MSLLGIDVGTSGVKVIILTEDGRVVASVTKEYPVNNPKPLWSEQNPEEWWDSTCAAVRQALSSSDLQGSAIQGIGVSGQMVGLVILDGNCHVLRPCILWNDQRSAKEAEELTERIGLKKILKETSNPMFATFVAPKIEWVRRHEPDVFRRITHVLLPKDYIVYRLTDRIGTEVSDASGTCLLNVRERKWSKEIIKSLDVPEQWFPECTESDEVIGEVTDESASASGLKAGTSVVAGAGDQPSQSLGCGIVSPGLCSVTIGTSGVVFAQAARHIAHPDGLLHSFCHSVHGQWYLMGVMLSAGGSFQWLRDTISKHTPITYERLTELAGSVPPGSEGLIYLPYLTGERVPYNNPLARAGWIGLTQRHGLSHMIRAVMEGISFGLCDSVQIMRDLGMEISRIYASGGAAQSRLWRQILADVFNVEIVTTNVMEGAAFGAAMLAGIGIKTYSNAVQAVDALITVTGSTEPNTLTHEIYTKVHSIYRRLYPQLEESFNLMSEISQS